MTAAARADRAGCYARARMRRWYSRGPAHVFLWMATYGVCVLLVLSFILFEVLDVDGSDFASPMRAAATLKITEPTPDVRRVPTPMSLPAQAIVVVLDQRAEKLQVQHRVADACADTPSQGTLRRASRSMLARGLLADPARSV